MIMLNSDIKVSQRSLNLGNKRRTRWSKSFTTLVRHEFLLFKLAQALNDELFETLFLKQVNIFSESALNI
jgi:hypothetical protein